MNTWHVLKHISSFQPIFEATAQISSDLLSSWVSDHHNRSRLTGPAQCPPSLIQGCGYTISAGTCAPPVTHHNPLSPLCSISPSFPPACPLDPSVCECMPGHMTPCYDREPPFNEVCSLSVSRWGSKPNAEPLLFTVHWSLRPVAAKGKAPAYNFNSTSKRKKSLTKDCIN